MYTEYRERVDIFLTCKQIVSQSSQSDIRVNCYIDAQGKWNKIGQTEIVEDNSEPTFSTPFTLDFIFEVQQPIVFEVLNVSNRNSPEEIGTVQTTVGSVMGARRQTSVYSIKSKEGKVNGQLVTQGEKIQSEGDAISWQWKGLHLVNTDGSAGKSNPFLRFYKIRTGGDLIKVHETEVIQDSWSPVWKHFEIPTNKLCYDKSKMFKIECWDWEKAGKYQFIGECQMSLDMIKNGITQIELTNPKTKNNTGLLQVSDFTVKDHVSFIDYLKSGTQLNAIVAIDFTGSNGDPQYSYSLHYMNPKGELNEYQKAITSVCQIVLNYDYDQQVPVYGFGGKPHYPILNSNKVSHCFPVTGNPEQDEVGGLQGIMDVYEYGLKNVEMAGPTYFAPLLTEALDVCKIHKERNDDVYTILLILTDGEIHDMDETIDAVVEASELPISIIIVGIGKADFTNMTILDGDDGLVDTNGKKAIRDAVQFVPFNEFNGDMNLLAQKVLEELPDQVVQYMKMIGKQPSAQ